MNERQQAIDQWNRDYAELAREDAKPAKEGAPMIFFTTAGHESRAYQSARRIGKTAWVKDSNNE